MDCKKCKASIPDGAAYCPWCGMRQERPTARLKTRANGTGTAYRRGKTWTAEITLGYKTVTDGDKTRTVRNSMRVGGFNTKTDALKHCAAMRGAKKQKKRRVLTFSALYDEWESYYKDKIVHSTLNCYRAAKKYYDGVLYLPFDDIDLDDLQECVDECPRGKRTKENMKALASLMYHYALPRHMSDMDYAQYIDTGSGAKGTHPAFASDQVELIKSAVGTVPYADYICCLIYTGFRPVELFGLTRQSYRTDNAGGYFVGGVKTDAGKDRSVPVALPIQNIVADRLKTANPYIFPRPDGTQMSAKYFRDNFFYAALAAVGIQPIPTDGASAVYVPYSCRHTFSNLLKNAPGSDVDKAALIGHASYDTTKKLYQSDDMVSKHSIITALK